MDSFVAQAAEKIGLRAERELEALVAVSSPSGDVAEQKEPARTTTCDPSHQVRRSARRGTRRPLDPDLAREQRRAHR